jgi:hypothetical protein
MPEISRFLGVVITMHWREHPPPHFHARTGAHQITVEIESGAVSGRFPPRALRLVQEWRELHKDELLVNWERAEKSQIISGIAPLE